MAKWLEGNLGRAQTASEALARGQNAMSEAMKNLHARTGQLTDIAANAWQNELQRKLQREMPMLQAGANIHQIMGTEEEKARARGIFERPGEQVQGTVPGTVPGEPSIQDQLKRFDPGFIEPEKAQSQTSEVADGTKSSADYVRMFSKNPDDWRKLKFTKDGKEITSAQAMAGKGKVQPGVIVDYSALAPAATNPNGYAEFMEKNKLTPETYKPPTALADVMPDRMKMTEQARPQTGPAGDKSRYGSGMPGDWLSQSEDIAMNPEIRRAKETDLWRMRSAEVEEEYGNSKTQAWKDGETMRRVFGYAPIDYRDKGSKFDEDKKKRVEGSLGNLAAVEGGQWLGTPDGKAFFELDPVSGGYKLAKGADQDEALARLADVIARRSEPGVSRTQFYYYTERGDWKKYMNEIQKPPKGMTKDQAIAKWRDEVILPYLRDEMSKKGAIASQGEEEGGGIYSTAWSMSVMNPVAKAITESKMGKAESEKMWEQFSRDNVSPFQMSEWVNKYLTSHNYKPLSGEENAKLKNGEKNMSSADMDAVRKKYGVDKKVWDIPGYKQ